MNIYIIGALKNDQNVMKLAQHLRTVHDATVFDQWVTPGPQADEFLFAYAQQRGWNYKDALGSAAARNNFDFDKRHLDLADVVIMMMPAGKSAHLELGYAVGQNKKTFILFDHEPDRFDLMYQFVDLKNICFNQEELDVAIRAVK